jgi:hypothetical protein
MSIHCTIYTVYCRVKLEITLMLRNDIIVEKIWVDWDGKVVYVYIL